MLVKWAHETRFLNVPEHLNKGQDFSDMPRFCQILGGGGVGRDDEYSLTHLCGAKSEDKPALVVIFCPWKLRDSPRSPSSFPFPCSCPSREGWGCLLAQHHPLPAAFQTFHMETPAPAQTDSHRPSRLFLAGSRHRASLNSSPQNNTVVRSPGSCQSSRQPLFFICPQNRQFLSYFPAVQFSSDNPRRKEKY